MPRIFPIGQPVAGVTDGSNPGTLSYVLNGSYTGVALEGNQLTVDSSVTTGTTITIKVIAEETGNYNKEGADLHREGRGQEHCHCDHHWPT